MISHLVSILVKLFVTDNFQYFHAHSTLDWTSTESIKVDFLDSVSNLLSCCHSTQWKSVTDSLGHSDDIRLHTTPLKAPEILTNTAKSSLDLIGNTQTTMLSHQCVHMLQIVFWRWLQSTYTHNWLRNEGCDLST